MRQFGNGSGSITKVKSTTGKVRYRVRVTLGSEYNEDTGKSKLIQKSLGTYDTMKKAQEVLVEYHKSPYDLTSKVKSFEDLYNEWYDAYSKKVTESALRTVRSSFAYCEAIKSADIKTLNIGVLKAHVENCWRYDEDGLKKYATPNTQARVKSLLNLVFDYAVEYNLVNDNPARKFNISDETLKKIRKNVKHKKAFSEEEVKMLWEGKDAVPFTDILLVGIYTGFRPQELATIPVNRVHYWGTDGKEVNPIVEGSTIYEILKEKFNSDIDGVVDYLKDKDFIVYGMKTEAGADRIVPIHSKIKPFIESYYRSAINFFKSDALFNSACFQNSTKLTYDKLRGRFKKIMSHFKLLDFSLHCLRVTFVTRARREFHLDDLVVETIVGHEHEERTLLESTYTYRTSLDIVTSVFDEIVKIDY